MTLKNIVLEKEVTYNKPYIIYNAIYMKYLE